MLLAKKLSGEMGTPNDGNRAVVRGPSMVAYSLDPEERLSTHKTFVPGFVDGNPRSEQDHFLYSGQ